MKKYAVFSGIDYSQGGDASNCLFGVYESLVLAQNQIEAVRKHSWAEIAEVGGDEGIKFLFTLAWRNSPKRRSIWSPYWKEI